MNQIELLLRLSENAVERGDEIAGRHHAERAAHAKELADLHRMIEVARQNVESEMHRWGYRGPKTPDVGQGQLPSNIAKDSNAPQTPREKQDHPRAIPNR